MGKRKERLGVQEEEDGGARGGREGGLGVPQKPLPPSHPLSLRSKPWEQLPKKPKRKKSESALPAGAAPGFGGAAPHSGGVPRCPRSPQGAAGT